MGLFSRFKKQDMPPEYMQEPIPQVPPPESNVELQTFLVTPDSQQRFGHIDRDMTLSNLSDGEVLNIRTTNELVNIFDLFGLPTARSVFEHDGKIVLASARSRRGFERKMVSTIITKHGKEEEPRKKPFI